MRLNVLQQQRQCAFRHSPCMRVPLGGAGEEVMNDRYFLLPLKLDGLGSGRATITVLNDLGQESLLRSSIVIIHLSSVSEEYSV